MNKQMRIVIDEVMIDFETSSNISFLVGCGIEHHVATFSGKMQFKDSPPPKKKAFFGGGDPFQNIFTTTHPK